VLRSSDDEDFTSNLFVCPSSQDERAPGATAREAAEHLAEPGHLSYVYVAAGMRASGSPEVVLMYDRPENHGGRSSDGITILFDDGHAGFHGRDAAKWFIDELQAGHNPPRQKRTP
jgi:hypothetical protein